jgi:hypothetical protein
MTITYASVGGKCNFDLLVLNNGGAWAVTDAPIVGGDGAACLAADADWAGDIVVGASDGQFIGGIDVIAQPPETGSFSFTFTLPVHAQ